MLQQVVEDEHGRAVVEEVTAAEAGASVVVGLVADTGVLVADTLGVLAADTGVVVVGVACGVGPAVAGMEVAVADKVAAEAVVGDYELDVLLNHSHECVVELS